MPAVKLNLLDRAIGAIDPARLTNRIRHRMTHAMIEEYGYPVGGSRNSSLKNYNPPANTADEDINDKLESIRGMSRDLYANSAIANASIKRIKTNVIGSGLKHRSKLNAAELGLSDEDANVMAREIEREFGLWAESKYADITHTQNFYQLQALVTANMFLSGDVFVIFCNREDSDMPYNLRLKVVEADACKHPDDYLPFSESGIINGIQYDDDGRPETYHFIKASNSKLNMHSSRFETVGIDAFTECAGINRKNVLHLFDRERPGQRRGLSILAPVIEQLKMITTLTKSELDAAVVTSFFTVFFTSDKPEPIFDGVQEKVETDKNGNESKKYEMNLGHGSMFELDAGVKPEFANPNRPNQAFEPFFNALVKQISASISIPFEVVMQCFMSSYSASRAALLEAWKLFTVQRKFVEDEFCAPTKEAFMLEAVMSERIYAPGFLYDPRVRKAWCASTWNGPGQGMLNPVQETTASVMKIDNCMSTLDAETSATSGAHYEDNVEQIARERAFMKKKGVGIIVKGVAVNVSDKKDDTNEDN